MGTAIWPTAQPPINPNCRVVYVRALINDRLFYDNGRLLCDHNRSLQTRDG